MLARASALIPAETDLAETYLYLSCAGGRVRGLVRGGRFAGAERDQLYGKQHARGRRHGGVITPADDRRAIHCALHDPTADNLTVPGCNHIVIPSRISRRQPPRYTRRGLLW